MGARRFLGGLAMVTVVLGTTRAEDAPRLPSGPAPVQIIARMDDKESLVLIIPYNEYVTKELNDGVGTLRLVPVPQEETRTVPLREVTVYGTDGKEVDAKRLSELLAKPVRALCSVDGKPMDLLHFRVVKDGTLIFVGPVPKSGEFRINP